MARIFDVIEYANEMTDEIVHRFPDNTTIGDYRLGSNVIVRDGQTAVFFRDHFLSDLIGFVYARMGAHDAASHFLARIRENCRSLLASGRDALVPVILDGENAWEYYDRNGRPFLRELYGMISRDPEMKALTVSEALSQVEASRSRVSFPDLGSTRIMTSGSALKKIIAPGTIFCARAKPTNTP